MCVRYADDLRQVSQPMDPHVRPVKTVALLYTITCIIQQLDELVEASYGDCKQWLMSMDGMHLPRLEFSVKQIGIMIIITIVATTMGSGHGSTHV